MPSTIGVPPRRRAAAGGACRARSGPGPTSSSAPWDVSSGRNDTTFSEGVRGARRGLRATAVATCDCRRRFAPAGSRIERSRLGLDEACLLLGHRNDVPLLHHAFDLFVQSSDYEGTPNAVLEAMSLETPIVATDVGGTTALVTARGARARGSPAHPGAVAAAITRLLDEPAATRRRVATARARVEGDLSFRARMATVERIYDLLAARGPAQEVDARAGTRAVDLRNDRRLKAVGREKKVNRSRCSSAKRSGAS